MNGVPIRRAQFRTADFAAWLVKQGAEIGRQTNSYEVIRYRAYHLGSAKALTHIVYAKETGLLTWTGASRLHYAAFAAGMIYRGMFVSQLDGPVPAQPTPAPKTGPSKSERRRNRLLMRDGDGCWFCGLAMGDDITIEHLVSKSKGGSDQLANFALAHKRCNALAGDRPLVEKIELRAQLRASPSLTATPAVLVNAAAPEAVASASFQLSPGVRAEAASGKDLGE